MIRKKLIPLVAISFLVAFVVAGYQNEKITTNNQQSNNAAINKQDSSDLARITSVLFKDANNNQTSFAVTNFTQYLHEVAQSPIETSSESPSEQSKETSTETPQETAQEQSQEAKVEKPTEPKATAAQAPEAVATMLTDAEAKEKAVVLNNSYRNMVSTIISETNAIRTGVGASTLTENATLTQIAMFRAAEMANSSLFSHTRPNGLVCFSVYEVYSYKYTAAGENLAWNSNFLGSPVEGWRTSEGHYKNMISTSYNQIGIGVAPGIYNGNQGFYYVQVFSN